ncbi:hypothetical protein HS088_TW19G00917 [Tripterygium wilfordii]|uniref:Uncharacterized protein n=1 Tax=Tripterygium wilfordii TaxID=458696 RepID=A0A7J7CB18_TRIWF|nr:hypothetical protein HS088_TW19G00917 [Tripterygium wilfordii]
MTHTSYDIKNSKFKKPKFHRETDDVFLAYTTVAENEGIGGEHERAVVGIFGVVGGGEVDAGTPFEGREEGGSHAGPHPRRHSVQFLIRQTRGQIVHAPTLRFRGSCDGDDDMGK